MNAEVSPNTKPITDQPVGEIPVDAKLLPSFSRCGWREFRRLLSIKITQMKINKQKIIKNISHLTLIAIIVDIIFAAIAAVEPLS